MWARITAWAKALRRDALTVWFCARHPGTPLVAKALALLLAAYAFSPIDLIPDFIPVLGYLDEMILLPAGLWLCLRMVPAPVLAECRDSADRWFAERRAKPRSLAGAAIIGAIGIGALALCWHFFVGA